jgi:hypothetical protein
MTTLEKLKQYCRKDLSPVEQLAIQQEIDIIVLPRLIAALEYMKELEESDAVKDADPGYWSGVAATLKEIKTKLEGEK